MKCMPDDRSAMKTLQIKKRLDADFYQTASIFNSEQPYCPYHGKNG